MCTVFLKSSLDIVLSAEQCFNDDIIDARPEQVHVDTNLLEMLAEGTQTPLIAKIVLLCVLILNKPVIFLVDRVIGQMHILILFVYLLSVCLGGEPRKALLEYIESKWLVARDEHINSQVKLMTIDKERVCDVFRNNAGLIHIYIVNIIDNIDATALTGICRLHDPHVFLALMLL